MENTHTVDHEEASRLAEFERRIDNGDIIEPNDWMPAEYRRLLIRQISQHAHSEVIGMLPEGNWISRAPSLRRKLGLLAKVQDEGGHGLYLYAAAETLGATRDNMVAALLEGRAKYSTLMTYPTVTWADVGAVGWLGDGAGVINQTSLLRTSYGPYARALARICMEESFHQRQGYEIMCAMADGGGEQRRMAQGALDRWWAPALMMFGPPDDASPNSSLSMRWRIKRESNDTLRQRFVDATVPQAEAIGLRVPDPQLRWNEDKGGYDFTPIDTDELLRVAKTGGMAGLDRLTARRAAVEEGAWVRRAMLTHARKQRLAAGEAA